MKSPDRAPVKLPQSVLVLTSISLSNEQEKDAGLEISGLTNTRFCTSHKTLASVVRTMVGDTLTLRKMTLCISSEFISRLLDGRGRIT